MRLERLNVTPPDIGRKMKTHCFPVLSGLQNRHSAGHNHSNRDRYVKIAILSFPFVSSIIDFAHIPAPAHGHPVYAPSLVAFASAFCGAWSRCECPLGCWALRHYRGRSVPPGEIIGRLNSEDIRMEAAQIGKSRTKYFQLQTVGLQKSVQKILRVEDANAPLCKCM